MADQVQQLLALEREKRYLEARGAKTLDVEAEIDRVRGELSAAERERYERQHDALAAHAAVGAAETRAADKGRRQREKAAATRAAEAEQAQADADDERAAAAARADAKDRADAEAVRAAAAGEEQETTDARKRARRRR